MSWHKPYTPARNRRLDPAIYAQAGQVCFITIRAYHNRSPFCDEHLCRTVISALGEEQAKRRCIVYTYCLMPDHLHFLVSPLEDGASVLTFTERFKGKTTNASWSVGWQGKLWQPRYYDHIVRKEESLLKIAQYILDNPVRKGLCGCVGDWPWSGQMNPVP